MNATATGELAPASARLPERQREVLALREEGLSYEEIAARLEATPDRVGQLLAHAWINLYDEQVGTVLASVAPTPDCERALGLIAARHDGELEAGSPDGEWLEAHLAGCHRCRRGVEEIGEAHALYRSSERGESGHRRRRATPLAGAVGLAALLVGASLAMALVGGEPARTPAEPAAGAAVSPRAASQGGGATAVEEQVDRKRRGTSKKATATAEGPGTPIETAGSPTTPAEGSVPVEAAGGGEGGSTRPPGTTSDPSGQATLQPPRRVSAPAPKPQTTPMPATAAPASTADKDSSAPPAPAPEPEAVPNGNAPAHSNRPSEPPGKAADRP